MKELILTSEFKVAYLVNCPDINFPTQGFFLCVQNSSVKKMFMKLKVLPV